MSIASISIDKPLLVAADELGKKMGLSGRSELIRNAIHALIAEEKQQLLRKEKIKAVILLIHKEHTGSTLTATIHHYQKLIQTQLHHHDEKGQCLEILLVRGQALDIREFVEELRRKKRAELVKIVPY